MNTSRRINVVIPMAGKGSRFYEKGYKIPKPFIDVHGKMMIERVLDNLQLPTAKYFLIALQEHIENYKQYFNKINVNYDSEIIPIYKTTDGPACTVLATHRQINNEIPLLIANSDQVVDIKISDYIDDCFKRNLDGSIMTFKATDPKWSFAKINQKRLVTEVKEKVPISNNATVGIYFFKEGKYFFNGAIDMIAAADKTNNEYYVCPIYNYIIRQGGNIGIFEIDPGKMHGTGTPEDLEEYLFKIKKHA
ncbi:MAG: glycosyltransferase family 2 protein [Holosporales bacterium]|nr:glycosyltransferase family 2 protein [Holosporales bacterium]